MPRETVRPQNPAAGRAGLDQARAGRQRVLITPRCLRYVRGNKTRRHFRSDGNLPASAAASAGQVVRLREACGPANNGGNGAIMQVSYRDSGSRLARLELLQQFVFFLSCRIPRGAENIHCQRAGQSTDIDFQRVRQIDSAALGMLRCLIYDEPRYLVGLLNPEPRNPRHAGNGATGAEHLIYLAGCWTCDAGSLPAPFCFSPHINERRPEIRMGIGQPRLFRAVAGA